jgi:SDR family mycofactocin-dependent oxidoreductase
MNRSTTVGNNYREDVMGRVSGKVALITGAARGQGRSHAVRLAEEGADVALVDICSDLPTVRYALGTKDDLAETVRLVEAAGRRALAIEGDVRELAAMERAVGETLAAFGKLDVVVANAGILTFGKTWELTEDQWSEMIGVNLDGTWKTVRAAVPPMIEADSGGSIILTSSTAGKRGFGNLSHYTAAKHGVVGLCKSLAVELAPHKIRVNTVHPTTVNTDLALNPATYEVFMPDVESPTEQQIADGFQSINMLPIPWIEARDVSNAVLYLASDESRYVTASQMYVDAGTTES